MTERNFRLFNRLLIEKTECFCKLAVVENKGALRYLEIIPQNDEPRIAQIYFGTVRQYNAAMQSAIADVGKYEVFLQSKRVLKQGEQIPLQIVRGREKTKKPKASSDISIGGEYVVLLKEGRGIKASKKNEGDRNTRKLIDALKEYYPDTDFGILLRSKATLEHLEQAVQEIESFRRIIDFPEKRDDGLYYDPNSELDLIARLVNKYRVGSIICNRKDFLKQLKKELASKEIDFMLEEDSLFARNGIRLDRFLAMEYKQDSFSLTINYPEALTMIDINSGYIKNDALREYKILEINTLAFQKIMELIELLHLNGLILVDFISMNKKTYEKFSDFVEKNLADGYNSKGRIRSYFLTENAVLQLNAERRIGSVIENIAQPCPTCLGSGKYLSNDVLIDEFELDLRSMQSFGCVRKLLLYVPDFFAEEDIEKLKLILLKLEIDDHRIERQSIKKVLFKAGD